MATLRRHGLQDQIAAKCREQYRAEYGETLLCGYARIGGRPCGVVANQRKLTQKKMPGGKSGPSIAVNMPAVIYDDSADKAARFIWL